VEDNHIMELFKQKGKNWSEIAKIVKTRNGKQIRDRYLNYLDPKIKRDKFSKEDDELILGYYVKFGPKWSLIAKFIKDRTGDLIKNRFYSHLKSKIHQNNTSKSKKNIKIYRFSKRTKPKLSLKNVKDLKLNPINTYNNNEFNSTAGTSSEQNMNYSFNDFNYDSNKREDMTYTDYFLNNNDVNNQPTNENEYFNNEIDINGLNILMLFNYNSNSAEGSNSNVNIQLEN